MSYSQSPQSLAVPPLGWLSQEDWDWLVAYHQDIWQQRNAIAEAESFLRAVNTRREELKQEVLETLRLLTEEREKIAALNPNDAEEFDFPYIEPKPKERTVKTWQEEEAEAAEEVLDDAYTDCIEALYKRQQKDLLVDDGFALEVFLDEYTRFDWYQSQAKEGIVPTPQKERWISQIQGRRWDPETYDSIVPSLDLRLEDQERCYELGKICSKAQDDYLRAVSDGQIELPAK